VNWLPSRSSGPTWSRHAKAARRGARLTEILKQGQYQPLPVERQVLIIYAAINGFLDDLPVSAGRKFEDDLFRFMENERPKCFPYRDQESAG